MDRISAFKKWRKRLRILMACVLVSTSACFALLQTPWGKANVASIVSAQLQAAGMGTTKIESITGLVPFRMRIGRVEISDAKRRWLQVENIVLQLSSAKLFLGRVHITELHVDHIVLSDLPRLAVREETSWSVPQIPDLPSWLVVKQFEIQQLDVGRDVLGREGSFTLSGKLLQPKRGKGLDLTFQADQLGESTSTFSVQLLKEQDTLMLDASLHDSIYLPELLGITEPVSLSAVGSGPFTDWAGELELKIGGDRLGRLEVRVRAGDAVAMACTGRLQLENAIFPAGMSKSLGVKIVVEAEAVLSDEGLFEVDSFVLTSDLAEIRIGGSVELEHQTVDGNVLLSYSQIGKLIDSPSSMRDKPVKLQVLFKGLLENLEVGLVAWVAEEKILDGELALKATAPFQVQGELRYRSKGGLWPDPIDALVSDEILLALDLRYDPNSEMLDVEKLSLSTHWVDMVVEGSANWATQELHAQAKLTFPDLSALADATGLELKGSAEAEIVAATSSEILDARLELNVRDLEVDSLHIERAQFVVHSEGAPREPRGDFLLNLTENGETIVAEGDYRIDESAVFVPGFVIRNRENRVEGSGELQYSDSQGRGNARATFPDLRSLGEFFHTRVEGSGSAAATFSMQEIGSLFKGEIALHDVRSTSLGMKDGQIGWEIDNVTTSPEGHVEFSATSVEVGESIADSIDFTADLRNETVHVNSQISGSIYAGVPWEVTADAVLPLGKGRFELTRLDGNVDHYDFHLLGAAALLVSDDEVILEPVRVQVADGTIQGYAKWSDSVLDARAQWENLPLSAGENFGLQIAQGTLEGELQLTGTPRQPEGKVRFSLADLRTPGMLLQPDLPSLLGSGRVELYEDRLTLKVQIDASPENVLSGEFTFPAHISFAPFRVDTSEEEAWRGNLALHSDLDLFPALLTSEEFHIEGQLDGNFEVSGALDRPRITGTATIEGGRFEHTTWGTRIEDISIELAAYGDRLELARATGTDGNDGTISAQGEVHLQPDAEFPFQVAAELIGMNIVNHDDLASEVDARFTVSGTFRDMEVLGNVRLGPTTLILRSDPSAQIIELAVVERNGEETQATTPPSPEPGRTIVRLNVSLEVPGRVVILATDLRTEWRGNLKIGGTVQSPTLEGELRTVHGQISVLGRRFLIDEEESIIVFDAATSPPAPYFNIVATASREDVTARLVLRGTLKEMELSLTSDPALPTDEILSLLLFGRKVTEISPTQALQLVRAAALFSGSVDGLPFLSGPSRMRGIDTFDVKMAEGAPVVGVGKYLADGVFLELEQGVGLESSKVRVEIDLLPTLKLESTVGANALGGLGLFWKWNH